MGWNWAKENLQWCHGKNHGLVICGVVSQEMEGRHARLASENRGGNRLKRKYFSCQQDEWGVLRDFWSDSKSVCVHVLFCNWPKHIQQSLAGPCWAKTLVEVKWRRTSESGLLENVHRWNCRRYETQEIPSKMLILLYILPTGDMCVISNCFQ